MRNTALVTSPTDPNWADPRAHHPPYYVPPQPLPPGPYAPQQYAPQQYGGQPYPGQPYGWPGYGYGPAPRNGPGTAALTLGIIALCTFWVPLLYLIGALPCAIIAIVQGSKGRKLAAAGWATNGGKAKAGVVCGVIALILCVLDFALGILLSYYLN